MYYNRSLVRRYAAVVVCVFLVWGQVTAMRVGANFWRVEWGSGTADPFVNGYQNVTGTNPWKPEVISDCAIYTHLRFMDWVGTNESRTETWANRKRQTDRNQGAPMAWEWCIDLCNRTNTDMWVNIHHSCSWDYSYNLAQLIHAQLKPSLRVYIEWSNETWNSMFPAYDYANQQGTALGLRFGGASYHVYAAVRHFQQFERVFGKNSPRLIKVISGQEGNTDLQGRQMGLYYDPVINPDSIDMDAYAIAYMNATTAANHLRTVNNFNARFRKNVVLIAYEAHYGGHDNNPDDYQPMKDYLTSLKPYLYSFCYYTHSGTDPLWYWGLKHHFGQPLDQAHKYRAVRDWVLANPPVATPVIPATAQLPVRRDVQLPAAEFDGEKGMLVVRYALSSEEQVRVDVFGVDGAWRGTVLNERAQTGVHARMVPVALPVGTYIIKVSAGTQSGSRIVTIR